MENVINVDSDIFYTYIYYKSVVVCLCLFTFLLQHNIYYMFT